MNVLRIFQYIVIGILFLYLFTFPFMILNNPDVALAMLFGSFLAMIFSYHLKQDADEQDAKSDKL